jgi:hypothetical protein
MSTVRLEEKKPLPLPPAKITRCCGVGTERERSFAEAIAIGRVHDLKPNFGCRLCNFVRVTTHLKGEGGGGEVGARFRQLGTRPNASAGLDEVRRVRRDRCRYIGLHARIIIVNYSNKLYVCTHIEYVDSIGRSGSSPAPRKQHYGYT